MELFYFLAIISVILVNCTVFSLKYDHISDCHFYNIGSIHGDDKVTFICAESQGESNVFVEPNKFKCSNTPNAPDKKWPGTINFKNCRSHEISINYFDSFISLHTFIASDIELEKLESKFFRSARNLTHLDVSQNRLISIPQLLFFNAEKLAQADFSHNSIEQVDPLAFMGANNLESLNMSYNKIHHLDAKLFSTSKLLELDLSNNDLSVFEEHTFDNLTELKHLNLSFNPIGDLKIEIFTYLTNLETLDLRRIQISNIQLGTLSHQHKLISLNLSENNLMKLDFNHFLPVLPDLQSFDLHGNQLNDLTGFGNDLFPKLERLDIRNNSFNCLYLESFMKSVNWEKLRLPIDNPTVKAGETSIRGIKCEITIQTNEAKQENFDQLRSQAENVKTIETISNIQQTFFNELDHQIFMNNIYLTFICIILLVFFIVYSVKNFEQIFRRRKTVSFQHEKTDEPSSAQHTVEFKNHSDILLIKER